MKLRLFIISIATAMLSSCMMQQEQQVRAEIRPDEIDGHARVVRRYASPAPEVQPKEPRKTLFRQNHPGQVTLPRLPCPRQQKLPRKLLLHL